VKAETQQSDEQRLLLALLGSRGEQQERREILSLLRQVNWLNFLNTTSEDLYPHLAFGLEPYLSCLEAPPECERLLKARRRTAVHNLLLRHELGRTLNALQQSGIPALALKGVVLAYTVYPDPSLRPMSDLDLLVPPDKREKALLVLRTIGYEYPESVLAANRDHFLRLGPNQEFAPPLQLRGSRVLLEVHSQLECSEPVFPMSVHEFWSRSILVDLKGLRARTLCPEDFLFHLCLHQSRSHRFEKGLLPLIDLKLLLDSRLDWNWAGIVERSLQYGYATWMYLTLEIARDLVGAPVPNSFFQALPRPGNLSTVRSLVEEQIWSAQSGRPVLPPFLPTFLAELSWRSRARMLLTRTRLVGRGELGSEPTVANHVLRARLSIRRLLATLRTKIPRYVSAWRSGQLKLRTIRQNAVLLRSSNTLFRLIEQETTFAHQNSLAESASQALLESSANRGRPIRFD
jgi:putative nucleotidyltransferase-like protein